MQVQSEAHVVEKLWWKDSGVHVPLDLSSHASTAYVINQKARRLHTQVRKGGVAARCAEAENAQLEQADQLCTGIDALDDTSLPEPVRVRPAPIFALYLVPNQS
jgi:hypothetical protein